jgi:hypothetical protein
MEKIRAGSLAPEYAHKRFAISRTVHDGAPVTPLIGFGALCNQITKIGFEEIILHVKHLDNSLSTPVTCPDLFRPLSPCVGSVS